MASTGSTEGRMGRAAAGSAVLAAVLSSACCWLPLVLIGAGTSAAGVAAFFEDYRVHFLVGATSLLCLGLYYVYFRRPTCAPGEACAAPNPRVQRTNRVTLWLATAFFLLFATFPEYIAELNGSGSASSLATAADLAPKMTVVEHSYRLEGMTCEGCTVHARKAIAALPGVQSVDVSYPTKTASVSMTDEVPLKDLADALSEYGYRITAVDGESVPATD